MNVSESLNSKVPVYGFTLLRNGVKFDYSFHESLGSLAPICRKIYLAFGESEDATANELEKHTKLEIVPTRWDPSLREGGLILSQQTNVALESLRKNETEAASKGAWGFYLQADEVLHECDYQLILDDIALAEEQGCDAIRFRYFHFWQSHSKIAINKKWYPQEIRAVRLDSKVESWGDAQSFRHFTNVYESDATIYHYGHVRDEDSYEAKKEGFFRMYAGDAGLAKYVAKMEKKDARTETLDFWGSHPEIMKERIERLGEPFAKPKATRVNLKNLDGFEEYAPLIDADEVFRSGQSDASFEVNLKDGWFKKFPRKMRSDFAREWPADTFFMLKCSAEGLSCDHPRRPRQ